jgi:IS605 OrfB family transposase
MHKWTTQVARSFRTILVGDVSSSQLARTKMAKSILDAGWSTARNALRYKASRHGGTYREVDEKFTTQTCSTTGIIPPERPRGIAGLGVRAWECSACGEIHDRDVNAARNILKLGLSAQPPAVESRVAHGR